MKNLILFAGAFFAAVFSQAQWEPDVRLTDDPGASWTSFNNAWCVAATGDTVHVVWEDDRDGNFQIYYKRSIDGGITWEPDVRLTNDVAYSGMPCIALFDSIVHVVWHNWPSANSEIYYIRSGDGGSTWGPPVRLIYASGNSWDPCIAVVDSTVHVVWWDQRNGVQGEIYYKHSLDGGITWGTDSRLTNSIGWSIYPSIAASGSNIHIVWYDNRDVDEEIYYKHSEDAGLTWDTMDTRLTNSDDNSEYPSIAVAGSALHVVWMDRRDENDEIYYKRNPTGNIPVGIENDLVGDPEQQFSIYPNPASSLIHIQFDDEQTIAQGLGCEKCMLSIRNILGETLITKPIRNGELVVDVSTLPNGIYFVEITMNGEKPESQKLIISR